MDVRFGKMIFWDVDILACPCAIQKSDVLFSTKNIASRNRQSGYGNLLGCKSSRPFSTYGGRSHLGYLLQVLTSDSMPCVDCATYCRNRLQKFIWALKTPRRVFLQKHLKQKGNRLWNIFESLKW